MMQCLASVKVCSPGALLVLLLNVMLYSLVNCHRAPSSTGFAYLISHHPVSLVLRWDWRFTAPHNHMVALSGKTYPKGPESAMGSKWPVIIRHIPQTFNTTVNCTCVSQHSSQSFSTSVFNRAATDGLLIVYEGQLKKNNCKKKHL